MLYYNKYTAFQIRKMNNNTICNLNDIYDRCFASDLEQMDNWDFVRHCNKTYKKEYNVIEEAIFMIFYEFDQIIGFVVYHSDSDTSIFILLLCVDINHRGKNYSQNMLDSLIIDLNLSNNIIKSIMLEVWSWNNLAIKSYIKYGFQLIKTYIEDDYVYVYEYKIE